jgi:hypothetical protein
MKPMDGKKRLRGKQRDSIWGGIFDVLDFGSDLAGIDSPAAMYLVLIVVLLGFLIWAIRIWIKD